jgi:uncharacterized protein YfaS (alpha-2-macroglobulin family)
MRKASLLAAVSILLLLAACNSKNRVNLVATNAKDEVPTLGNLVFTFDKNLVGDTLLNAWDTIDYIRFDPPITGRFQWNSSYELTFSPDHDLSPATDYKAVITNKLVSHSKFKMGNMQDLFVHTPYQRLESANAMWTLLDENSQTPVGQVELFFFYKVNPSQLKEKLSVEVDGVKADFNILTTQNDNHIGINLLNLKIADKDYAVKVKIASGLQPEGGKNGTKDAIEYKVTLQSPYILNINEVQAEHDGNTGTVHILTSQQVLSDGLDKLIQFDPPVQFKTHITQDGLLITSDKFDVTKEYKLTLKAGVKGRIGGTLKEDYTHSVAFGQLEPSIKFTNSKGVYLTPKGAKNIEVQIINVPQVQVSIYKIYENNLLASNRYGYSDDGYEGSGENYVDESGERNYGNELQFGDKVYETTINTKDLPKKGNSRLFKFDFPDKLKEYKGLYRMTIRSQSQYYLNESRFVSLSDIGLIAKDGRDKMYVFANSIKSAESMAGVTVSVYGINNQAMGSAVTNNEGVAEIEMKHRDLSGFKPAMIIAKTNGGDFNYMPFNTTRVETSRFEVGGKRANSTGLDAFVYAERDMYRPGETVHASVIIRDQKWKSPGEIPVRLTFLLPDGQEIKSFKKTLNDEGSMEAAIELSPAAVTGSYSLQVFTSNDVLLATKYIMVEEFMPDRIKVTTSLDKPFLKPGDKTKLSINAVNFFGPPAADRNYEVEMQINEKYFSPKKYNSFNFSLANRNSSFDKIERTGTTDDKGNASETFEVPAGYINSGLLQGDIFATVFDESGRPVSRRSTVDIFTQDVFYGIDHDGYYYYPLNQTIRFPMIALNKDEKPVNAQGHVIVIKHDYKTVLSKSNEYFRYESQREDRTIVDQVINIGGENTVYSFIPKTPGDYEIRLAKPGADAYVMWSFYSYGGFGYNSNSSFEVNNEGNIDISLDKTSYNVGESAKVLFKAPFNGRILVTLENDHVIDHFYLNTDKRTASTTISIKAGYLPNAYISATLIKPHEETDLPLTVAHGYVPIIVEEKANKIPVQILAEKSVRSRTRQKVTVKAAPGCKITLAAVDEGILQITGYKTPDPYAFFYQKRALDVNSFDLYPLLFPEVTYGISSTGGDASDMSKRVNPVKNKRVKLLTYWSGITEANGSGEGRYEFDIPQFSGEVRLMAVAYKDHSFGSTEAHMTVADPIVIVTSLPRFISPRDTVDVPVTVSNTTTNSTSASISIKAQGPIQFIGEQSKSVKINGKAEARVVFRLVANGSPDEAKVTVDVNAGEKFQDVTDITVRPAASLQKGNGSGSIEGGATKAMEIGDARFIPAMADYKLTISRSPMAEFSDHLTYLVQYPYGCTEQTVSAAFPQLYFQDLSGLMSPTLAKNTNYNINEAIRKIKMRQLYNGGLTLWDGEGTECWWASVYAAHFLIEAKKAGYDVSDDLLSKLLEYLNARLRNHDLISWYYNGGKNMKVAPHEVGYSLYVLALAGKQDMSTMNYYKSNPQLLTLDCKYLLSAAYALAGDKGKFKEMLPGNFVGDVSDKETGGSFASAVRDEAIALNVLAEVDPQNQQIPIMTKHVAETIKKSYYLSTQERVFSFLALGKVLRSNASSTVTAQVKVNAKVVGDFSGKAMKLTRKQLGGSKVEIATRGAGKLYYFYENEGITADGSYKQEDSYIKVRKQFYDRFGRAISGMNFKQNDLIIVGITIENSYSKSIDNVVITDMLPAGFEVENPRLKEIPGMDWVKDASTPTTSDYRDDRVNLFMNLYSGHPQKYYYAVRCVSPGAFVMGPVMADAMYAGEYHSYNGGGVVRITEK